MTELYAAAVSGGLSLIGFAALPVLGTAYYFTKRIIGLVLQAESYRR